MPLTILLPDGTKLGGDQMNRTDLGNGPFSNADISERLAANAAATARPTLADLEKVATDSTPGLGFQDAVLRVQNVVQARGVGVVAAELEHAQEQAARVKPLREELDQLLGRKTRARKAVAK